MADELSDLQITRLCAEAIGYEVEPFEEAGPRHFLVRNGDKDCDADLLYGIGEGLILPQYDPLHDDAQCMALEDWLIERGYLSFRRYEMRFNPFTREITQEQVIACSNKQERRRAICLCVARMEQQNDRSNGK